MIYEKYLGKETDFQMSAIRYLDMNGILRNHCPNEMKAQKLHYYAKRKRMGVSKGFPDVSVYHPTSIYHGLFIELKVHPNKVKKYDNQFNWIENLIKVGYFACWTNSMDEYMKIVDDYLDNKKIPVDENYRLILKN